MVALAYGPRLTTAAVDEVMATARRRAVQIGGGFAIAVLDHSAVPVAVLRLDGADPVTVGLALGKARVAFGNVQPTSIWRRAVAEDPYLAATIPLALDSIMGGAVLFGGGFPLRVDGINAGSIGVSGGVESDDVAVARAGLAALPEADQFPESDES